MRTCIKNGCNNPVYSHDFCRIHQWCRKDEKYLAYKERKKQGKIPPKSKKRAKEEKHYAQNCKELTEEIKSQYNGKIFCFFSGIEIQGQVTYHHLKKRIGNFYTDKDWLVPCINEYHLDYHFKSIDWLLKQKWYAEVFLPNLRKKSGELYQKELRKYEKVNKLNPKIVEEDDIF